MRNYTSVSSSNIEGVDHDGTDLYVKFLNGTEYKYSSVPAHVYQELLNAPSVGKYLNGNIKGTYNYEQVA